MASINSPRYPIFVFDELVFPSDFVMNVTIGIVTKRVRFSDIYFTSGAYRIDPFLRLRSALSQALTQVLGSTSNAQTPDGVFGLDYTVTATFTEPSEKNFPVVALQLGLVVIEDVVVDMDIEYAKIMGLASGTITFPLDATPEPIAFDYTPAGLWAPNSYNCQESRTYTRDLTVTSSAFSPSVYTVNLWGEERTGVRVYLPAQNAEFVFLYRRVDSNFSQYTETSWPNNLLQDLIEAARENKIITVYWDSAISEEFSIQDPERILNFNSNITDVSSERRYDVTLLMVKS